MTKVLYYAHDSGSGHLRHATNVARHPELDVLVVSSATVEEPPFAFRPLESDRVDRYRQPVGGPFHYTPVDSSAVRKRFEQLHAALSDFAPDVVISDVSAEVAAFAKLSGYRTIVRRMHGDRTDRAHRNMFDLADAVIAYYPVAFAQTDAVDGVHHLGMVAEPHLFDEEAVDSRSITVLTSLGGNGVSLEDIDRAAAQLPDWTWQVVGHSWGTAKRANVKVVGVVADVQRYLAGAGVVLASAGHNAVRAAVSARRPLVLCPEPRMYDEQLRFAEQISRVSGVPLMQDPATADWSGPLTLALEQDPDVLANDLMVDEATFFAGLSKAIQAALDA